MIWHYQGIWYIGAFSSQCKSAFGCLPKIGIRQTKCGSIRGVDEIKIRQHCDTQSIDESEDGANDKFVAVGQFSYEFPEEREKSH